MTTPHDTTANDKDPLQGLTLERLLTRLVKLYGWAELARLIPVRCFSNDPGMKSSLTFLRRTPWARQKVEELYVAYGHQDWLTSGFTDGSTS